MIYTLDIPQEVSPQVIQQFALSLGGEVLSSAFNEEQYEPTAEEVEAINRGLDALEVGDLIPHSEVRKLWV